MSPINFTQSPPIPESRSPSHMALYWTPSEFLLMLGRSRLAASQDASGTLSPLHMIEWFETLTMSPIVAKRLQISITQMVTDYEAKHGEIDPKLGQLEDKIVPFRRPEAVVSHGVRIDDREPEPPVAS